MNQTISIFDTETTDLIKTSGQDLKKQPRIVELYILRFVQKGDGPGAEFDVIEGKTFHQLFNPGVPIPEKASKIHGFTDDDVINSPKLKACAPMVRELFESSDMVVAHNMSFDKRMIDIQFALLGNKNLRWPRTLCTVEATEHLKGFRLSLAALHTELLGAPFVGAHNASDDVMALFSCYQELVRKSLV